ncbi:MAG: LysM peptidoglycan-binding domain-containing protein [Pseudohongiellaceae bacterium]
MRNPGIRQLFAALALGIVALGTLMSASAQPGMLVEDYPSSYIVQESDTLWEIASQFLRDPERWPEIWQPDEYLDNPDLIYPGDTLKLSLLGGTPRVFVQRGDRDVARVSPRVREMALQSAIPAIPLEVIENSFTRNRIVNAAEYETAPYIVGNVGGNLVIGTGDEIYVRGSFQIGRTSYEIYRLGRTYYGDGIPRKRVFGLINGIDEEVLGVELEYLGFASISENIAPDMRKLLVNNGTKEIRAGDRLLIREESSINATIFPTEPDAEVSGRIIAFLGDETLASQLDTVVIDLGLADNIKIGDILSIQKEGTSMTDEIARNKLTFRERMWTLFDRDNLLIPGEGVGTLLVYKTFDKLSYAVILSGTEPVELNNEVVNP